MIALLTVLGLLADVLSAITHGLVLKALWGWFMVPIFQLPAINIPEAIGICLVVGFLTSKASGKSEEWDEIIVGAIMYSIVSPIIVVVTGVIVKGFM